MLSIDVLIVGAGPAGLMAAQVASAQGLSVLLADQMPSPGRKFLMAGKSGLNLTKSEPNADFASHYTGDWLGPILAEFGPTEVCAWAQDLGQELFVGSTGRVFPKVMKASPLLRAWLARLEAQGVRLMRRWTWVGGHSFDTPEGPQTVTAKATVLALGGGSWRRLGSDGAWRQIPMLEPYSEPFQPSNVGLTIAWSAHMDKHFGQPLKNIALRAGDLRQRGEIVLTARGLEGGGLYALTPRLRAGAPLEIDLKPDLSEAEIRTKLARPRGKASLSTHLRKTLNLSPAAIALLQACARPLPPDLAPLIKALEVPHQGPRPLDEAISTAGGLRADALDQGLMLRAYPGVFACGEMIDWDAPTGGYLISACLATGRKAGQNAADWARMSQVTD